MQINGLPFAVIVEHDPLYELGQFSISISLSVRNAFQRAGTLTDVQYFDLLN